MLYACPKCGTRSPDRYCPDHKPKPWQASNRRAELPRGWSNRIVPFILERDPVCTVCTAAVSTEVHHKGDRHDHRYHMLGGICHDCHQAATVEQSRAARVG